MQEVHSKPLSLSAALERLRSLEAGFAGVGDVVHCGAEAVPALRDILEQVDPSGLFEVRIRAISALKSLRKTDVLIEFLSSRSARVPDPVARSGEEAVISTAARALIGVQDERIMPLLLRLAARHSLSGVVEAIAALRDPRGISALVNALREDEARSAAEAGLRKLGRVALPELFPILRLRRWSDETSTDLSARRSAARVIAAISIAPNEWPIIRPSLQDRDAEVTAYAMEAALPICPPNERPALCGRLRTLSRQLRFPLRERFIELALSGACAKQASARR